MSKLFCSNQFEDTYRRANALGIAKKIPMHPKQNHGFTHIISNDRGYLLEGRKRSKETPWGTFVRGHDYPKKVPGPSSLNPTSRRPACSVILSKINKDFDKGLEDRIVLSASCLNERKKPSSIKHDTYDSYGQQCAQEANENAHVEQNTYDIEHNSENRQHEPKAEADLAEHAAPCPMENLEADHS